MNATKWMAALALVFGAGASQAIPVQVTQTFHDVTWDDYDIATGVGYNQQATGDWIFKATFDSAARNQGYAPDLGGSYALTNITLTQASLGLHDVQITNLNFLNFSLDSVGFGFRTDFTGVPMTHGDIDPSYRDFNQINPFRDGYATQTRAGGLFRTREWGFEFANGTTLFGNGFAGSMTIGAVVAPVPEPETWLAMMAGLGVLAGRFAKKRAASSQPAMAAA